MKRFADLLDRLAYTPSRNAKLRLLADYFAATPDPDRGWALAALTDGLFFRAAGPAHPGRADRAARRSRAVPPVARLRRRHRRDGRAGLAGAGASRRSPPRLADVVGAEAGADRPQVPGAARRAGSTRSTPPERWALLKLLTGALRVGVSARLAKTALAEMAGRAGRRDRGGLARARAALRRAVRLARGQPAAGPTSARAPVFRPLMLSHPLEDEELAALDPTDFAAEWKWDGIRVQVGRARRRDAALLAHRRRHRRQLSRCGRRRCRRGAVLDGELLVVRDGAGRAVQRPAAAAQPQDRQRAPC